MTALPDTITPTMADAIALLRQIARIQFPRGARPNALVARTFYADDMLTVAQVRQAHDPSIPLHDGWSLTG